MARFYAQGEWVCRVHKVHIGHLLNLLFICMCNAGMCAYGGVCHAMSPLVGYVCIWGVCMGMCAYVGVCHAMSVFAAAKLPNDLGGRSDGPIPGRYLECKCNTDREYLVGRKELHW